MVNAVLKLYLTVPQNNLQCHIYKVKGKNLIRIYGIFSKILLFSTRQGCVLIMPSQKLI